MKCLHAYTLNNHYNWSQNVSFSQAKPEQSSSSAKVQPKPAVERKPCVPTAAGKQYLICLFWNQTQKAWLLFVLQC